MNRSKEAPTEGQKAQFAPLLEALADVSEDLAIELLASFQTQELPELGKTVKRLHTAANQLILHRFAVPYSVSEVLRLAKEQTN